MRKLILCLCMLCATQIWAQNEPYYGGFGDGNGFSGLNNYNHANPPIFYAYFGGNGDGSAAMDNILFNHVSPATMYAYFGGDGDGQAFTEHVPYSHISPPMFYAYIGGNGDGNAIDESMLYNHANPSMFYAYFGGIGDGYAGDLLPMWINPLSVSLISFSGKALGKQSLLEWKIAKEKDIRDYKLQRSGDGKTYTTINIQKSNPDIVEEKTYSYTDIDPLQGNNYYRLLITDNSGKEEYSNVVLLFFGHGEEAIAVYPNPAGQVVNVKYVLKDDAVVRITDMRGVDVAGQIAKQGTGILQFSIEQLAIGMYLLQLQTKDGFSKTIRFMKQ